MGFRSRRRGRYGRRVDLLEIGMVVLGVLFLILTVVCVVVVVTIAVNFGDPERGFPAGPGFVKVIKGLGIALFAVAAFTLYGAADWAFGDRVRLGIAHLIRRRKPDDDR